MNLFISENFIDTVSNSVNVLQLIRHVTDDDEIVHVEVMDALCRVTAYDSINDLSVDINNHHFSDIALRDDQVYVGGETLKDLFEDLYPDDYTAVIAALVSSITSATTPTLRVDHNGLPVVPVEVADASEYSADATPNAAASNLSYAETPTADASNLATMDFSKLNSVAPFPGDQEGTQVFLPEVATLSSELVLGNLQVNGSSIRTLAPTGKNGVLFNVFDLYFRAYGLQLGNDYIQQLLVERRAVISSDDIHVSGGTVYLNAHALAALHDRLCNLLEWSSLAATIVNRYSLNPHQDWSFDLLGNHVG